MRRTSSAGSRRTGSSERLDLAGPPTPVGAAGGEREEPPTGSLKEQLEAEKEAREEAERRSSEQEAALSRIQTQLEMLDQVNAHIGSTELGRAETSQKVMRALDEIRQTSSRVLTLSPRRKTVAKVVSPRRQAGSTGSASSAGSPAGSARRRSPAVVTKVTRLSPKGPPPPASPVSGAGESWSADSDSPLEIGRQQQQFEVPDDNLYDRFTDWKIDKELAIEAERQIILEQQENLRLAKSVDKGLKLSTKKETALLDRLYGNTNHVSEKRPVCAPPTGSATWTLRDGTSSSVATSSNRSPAIKVASSASSAGSAELDLTGLSVEEAARVRFMSLDTSDLRKQMMEGEGERHCLSLCCRFNSAKD